MFEIVRMGKLCEQSGKHRSCQISGAIKFRPRFCVTKRLLKNSYWIYYFFLGGRRESGLRPQALWEFGKSLRYSSYWSFYAFEQFGRLGRSRLFLRYCHKYLWLHIIFFPGVQPAEKGDSGLRLYENLVKVWDTAHIGAFTHLNNLLDWGFHDYFCDTVTSIYGYISFLFLGCSREKKWTQASGSMRIWQKFEIQLILKLT
jgi:hypothetical protein